MPNMKLLSKKIEDSGIPITVIAKKAGIIRATFYNRLDKGDWRVSEVIAITKVLRLTKKERDDIFLS